MKGVEQPTPVRIIPRLGAGDRVTAVHDPELDYVRIERVSSQGKRMLIADHIGMGPYEAQYEAILWKNRLRLRAGPVSFS